MSLAEEVHRNQKRKYTGYEYFTHLVNVSVNDKVLEAQAEFPYIRIVAMLHDVIEDASNPELIDAKIKSEYPAEIYDAVKLLTKQRGQSYSDYIKSIIASGNKMAMIVKYADAKDNSRVIIGLPEEIQNSRKYSNIAKKMDKAIKKLPE